VEDGREGKRERGGEGGGEGREKAEVVSNEDRKMN